MRPANNIQNHARLGVGLVPVIVIVGLMSAATLVLGPARLASAQAIAPSWNYTGNLNKARDLHTATLLPNGKVLVAGGDESISSGNSAELYDPATGTWSITGNLNTLHYREFTATLLQDGKVLVVGDPNISPSTELYDPASGAWSYSGNLNLARVGHTATLLPDSKILVAGGAGNCDNDGCHNLNGAEVYDPATGTWSYTGNLNVPRGGHTATLLPNGKVLVVGGSNCVRPQGCFVLNSAELYDPATGTWSITGNLNSARQAYTATLLPNGRVLVTGGFVDAIVNSLNSAELYEPATGTWSYTGNLNIARNGHTATLLTSGKVLVAAGNDYGSSLDSAELYDPATGAWSYTANLNTGRSWHTATLLPNGKVLLAGGLDGVAGHDYDVNVLNSAELYDPGANPISNQIDDARTFVRQQYLDFLTREPDRDGWDYWTSQITQCGTDARCIHDRRIGVSAAFFIELEFQDTGYYVYRFYKASFGRQPNFTEFTSDRGKVISGSNLEASKQAFADEWVQRPAFVGAYPITMSNTEVVNKLFDSAGLTASIYDPLRQQEILAMNAGRSRALVLRDVIEIPDFKNIPDPSNPRYSEIKQISQYNPAFVLMQYFGYLHRDIDPGYEFWLDVVNNREPNNYRGMVCSFITSTEYQLRFGSTVTRSNADCGH